MAETARARDLSPFVSRLAAGWMAEYPATRHRRLDGTLVSADLSGFTALSERLADRGRRGAEDLTAMVNACFTALIRAAAADGGDVLKFGGDALLVWFEGDGHPERAVRAAARMQRAIGANRFRRAGLSMSVGAHVGAFDHFLVGRDEWRELVVAGEPVTTTVTMEASASSGEVLLSRELAALVPSAWLDERTDVGVPLAVDRVDGVDRRVRSGPLAPIEPAVAERLVDPSLHDEIAALARSAGEHRLVTVAFAELHGTDRTISADPVDFGTNVDAMVRSVQELADRYQLVFLYTDVIADGLKFIAVAGAPRSTGEDEEAGLRFATELAGGDPKHKLRLGVNRGRVFAGFVGSEDRRTYTVMGDPVNLAARLMAKAEPGQVLASDEVVRASRAEFECTPLPPFLVKGKSRPVEALAVGAATGRRRAEVATGTPPFVGRDAEVEQLRAAVEGALGGRGAVIEIVGDAGIGKTRLLEAVLDEAPVGPPVRTECQPYDGLSPFAAARPLLRRAIGVDDNASPEEAGRRLTEVAAAVAPDVLPMLPLVAVPFGAHVPETPEAAATAEEFRQARMHDAVIDLLSAVLVDPTVLIVEDVYYVDDASLQLIRAIAASTPDRPWALFVTRRPEGAGLVVGQVPGTLLKLAPLDADLVARLAEHVAGDLPVIGGTLHAVVERSGGNPLFALELVAAAGAGLSADELPESVERVVSSRVDRLEPDDRALLRQAAVVGRVFHLAVVDALRAGDGRSAVDAARWARLAEFVEPEGGRAWRFRHALFRDVAYEGLPFARRKRMHRAVGELLEGRVAGEPDPSLLSLHFWLAGDAERTWRYSVEAGEAAWQGLAPTEAIAALRRATGVRRRPDWADDARVASVYETLGDALERSARYDEAWSEYTSALRRTVAEDRCRRARLLRKRGVVRQLTGKFGPARRLYRRSLEVAAEECLAERSETELRIAGLSLREGRHTELEQWARAAIATARAIGRPGPEAHAHLLLVAAALYDRRIDADVHGEAAEAIYREHPDPENEGKLFNNLGVLAYFAGQWDRAAQLYRRAASRFAASGDVAEEATAANNLAEILSDQGHLAEADEQFERARTTWKASGFALGTALATSNLGRARSRQGRHDEGGALLDEACELFEALGAGSYLLDTQVRRAEADVLAGRPEAATGRIGGSSFVLPDDGSFPATAVTRSRVLGLAALQSGDVDTARTALQDAFDGAERHGLPFEEAMAAQALAVAWADDDGALATAYEGRARGIQALLSIAELPALPRAARPLSAT